MGIADIEDAFAGSDRPHWEENINLEYGAAEETGESLKGLRSNWNAKQGGLFDPTLPNSPKTSLVSSQGGLSSGKLILGCVIVAQPDREATQPLHIANGELSSHNL